LELRSGQRASIETSRYPKFVSTQIPSESETPTENGNQLSEFSLKTLKATFLLTQSINLDQITQ
jgi:hypothetical protein